MNKASRTHEIFVFRLREPGKTQKIWVAFLIDTSIESTVKLYGSSKDSFANVVRKMREKCKENDITDTKIVKFKGLCKLVEAIATVSAAKMKLRTELETK